MQIKSRCLQWECFSQDPKLPQRRRGQGHSLNWNNHLYITVGESLDPIPGNLHRPLKIRSFLMWPSKPPLTPYVGEAKEGLGGAASYSDLFLLPTAPFSFTGLCNRPPFLPGTEGGRSLSHTHAFQLLNHQRGIYALPSYLITTLGPQCAAKAWNSLQKSKTPNTCLVKWPFVNCQH